MRGVKQRYPTDKQFKYSNRINTKLIKGGQLPGEVMLFRN